MRNAVRRADAILAATKTRRHRGRHARKPARHVHRGATLAATAVLLALGAGVGWTALDGHDPAPAAAVASDCPAPTAAQTDRYLSELELAGVPLATPQARETAARIGREHVAHCHLIGMRWQIERDFREQLPALTGQQVVDARVAVEHHFLDVTGRDQ